MQDTQLLKAKLLDMPCRYRGLDFNDFNIDYEDQKIIRLVSEQFVDAFRANVESGVSMIFMGGRGTGKTLLSMIIYQQLMQMGYLVCYESMYLFLKNIKMSEWAIRFDDIKTRDFYNNASLLILDNVANFSEGKATFSDREKELLFSVIDERYNNKRSTIVISNHNRATLTSIIGESCMDRLLEKGVALSFTWDSYRNKQGI